MSKKGREKNTKNKSKHTKLIDRKKNKLRKEKQERAARLKNIVALHKEQKGDAFIN